MDFVSLPPEIIEKIFLQLDTQALAACALVDECLAKLIYGRHFLDEYCRKTFCCSWLTAQDVHDVDIAVPFEFWFWVYETVKAQDAHHGTVIYQSKYLTKIGTLKHLFIMWLMCGHRSSFIDSHALMNVLYPLPHTVHDVFDSKCKQPEPFIIDTLMKIFFSLPEIMHVSCSNLKVFSMQKGTVTTAPIQYIVRTKLKERLPKNFRPVFSVEMLCASNSARTPALVILMDRDWWILWFGMVNFSTDRPDGLDHFCYGTYSHSVMLGDIKLDAKSAIKHFNDHVQSHRDVSRGSSSEPAMRVLPCPLITFENSDMADMTFSLAQESLRGLQKKFQIVLNRTCSHVIKALRKILCEQDYTRVSRLFSTRASQNDQIDEFVLHLLHVDMVSAMFNPSHQLDFVVYKYILERIAFMFRNEIHKSLVSNFSHAFLCNCLGPSFPLKCCCNPQLTIEKCLSVKIKDGLYSPQMWPPHVLSAACLIMPALAEVLKSDILLMKMGRLKWALSRNAVSQLNQKLRISGLTLTNRPPGKPRYPPVLKQVRLLIVDSLGLTRKDPLG
ncbi:uncharacterized protein LOC101862986 [Aplysia californica]|uniref:Uncharacterized protein LOC101862986 n=1 Tax=Aplysia californica TaxID=6500 RepID=A0ABM0JBA6_APLCA|nr:uncharacterized protein LOC101862986 [Aplysia californica]XP_012937479.1 uncharacterized protein LOC101862986 [Aplysia californica]